MSVLIKGMEMPEYCIDCYFYASNSRNDSCLLLKRTLGNDGDRESDCPLAEVPTPHGDLIDRDALYQSIKESMNECHKWANEIPKDNEMYCRVSQALGTFLECALRTKNAPTIIETEV